MSSSGELTTERMIDDVCNRPGMMMMMMMMVMMMMMISNGSTKPIFLFF